MKKEYLTYLFIHIFIFSSGQITFFKDYYYKDWDRGFSVQQTIDSGYVIAGTAAGTIACLIKTNAYGDTLWAKSYIQSYFTHVRQTSDSGFILTGRNGNIFLIKTDENGETLWLKTFACPVGAAGNQVIQTVDGGFVIVGSSPCFGSGNWDVYIIKTDANGDSLWSKNYGGINYETGYSLMQTTDGGFIISGEKEVNPGQWGNLDVFLIKTDSIGNIMWTKTFGGIDQEENTSVIQISDGYILAGSVRSYGIGIEDIYLVKLDDFGNIIWTKTYGGLGYEVCRSFQQTADGGYIIVGYTHSFGAGSVDIYLIKTNVLGDTLWTRTFGGAAEDYGYSVQQTFDNGYIISGYTNSYGLGWTNILLIKTNSLGKVCYPSDFMQYSSICNGDSFVVASNVYYSSGIYVDTIFNSSGWDSIVTSNINVTSSPTVTAFSTSTEICDGDSISLHATGASLYVWSDSIYDGINFIPASTNTYTVKGTDTNNCSDTASITINVHDPEITAYATSTALCQGQELTLTATGAVSYSWSNGISEGVPFVPDSTTTYTVVGTDQFNCSDSSSINITVHSLPIVTINIPDTAVCLGSPVTLTASGANTYFWTDGVLNGIELYPVNSYTIIVTGIDSNNCSDRSQIFITVKALPVVIPYATSTNICQGEAVSLIGTEAETYQWSDGISNGVSFTPTSSNTYTVIGTDTNNCSDTASITITVTQLPDVTVSLNGATLTANQAQAEYQWLNCDDGFSEISGATEQSYTAVENGNYAVFIDLDGCVDISECVFVNTVGIDGFSNGAGERIRIIPNPTQGNFIIESLEPISDITINNLLGEKIFEKSEMRLKKTEIKLVQPNGIYFLEIISTDQKEVRKLIIN